MRVTGTRERRIKGTKSLTAIVISSSTSTKHGQARRATAKARWHGPEHARRDLHSYKSVLFVQVQACEESLKFRQRTLVRCDRAARSDSRNPRTAPPVAFARRRPPRDRTRTSASLRKRSAAARYRSRAAHQDRLDCPPHRT